MLAKVIKTSIKKNPISSQIDGKNSSQIVKELLSV